MAEGDGQVRAGGAQEGGQGGGEEDEDGGKGQKGTSLICKLETEIELERKHFALQSALFNARLVRVIAHRPPHQNLEYA